mmetsp:Transcript_6252/g.19527  ORF Transcript_6252/g.19527 Transcript_6252/m.19527 type:complete len:273 (-) Transcript_6252:1069-1887(-)
MSSRSPFLTSHRRLHFLRPFTVPHLAAARCWPSHNSVWLLPPALLRVARGCTHALRPPPPAEYSLARRSLPVQSGKTALHWAAYNGHTDAIAKLLEMGATIEATDNDGRTAVHAAAFNGHTSTVMALRVNRAEVDDKDNSGQTPLMLAAGNGQWDVVEWLVRIGADAHAKDKSGKAAFDEARLNRHGDVAARLEAAMKAAFETALRVIGQHSATSHIWEISATNTRLLHGLARLASHQLELAAFEGCVLPSRRSAPHLRQALPIFRFVIRCS